MNTFTIGLGVSGTLAYDKNYLTQTSGTYADLKRGPLNWPSPGNAASDGNGDARNVDDQDYTDGAGYLSYELLGPGQFLRYCVKVSQLVTALTDDDYFLDSSCEESSNEKSTKNVISGERKYDSKHVLYPLHEVSYLK